MKVRSEYSIIAVPAPLVCGMKLFVCGFGRRADKGLFSCADGEAAGCDLFRKSLVEVIVHTLKSSGIKAVRKYRGPAYDVAASL